MQVPVRVGGGGGEQKKRAEAKWGAGCHVKWGQLRNSSTTQMGLKFVTIRWQGGWAATGPQADVSVFYLQMGGRAFSGV